MAGQIAHLQAILYDQAKAKGTGIGLSNCYGTIPQNEGSIGVYSQIGSGTTFKVYLPILKGTHPSSTPSLKPLSDAFPRETELVLLIENGAQVRELTARVLRQQGYIVLEPSNGVEALRVASQPPGCDINLPLADVVMPLIGRRELSTKLKDIHPAAQAIYTSGYTDEAVVRHGMLEPDTVFFQKPYSLAGLSQKNSFSSRY